MSKNKGRKDQQWFDEKYSKMKDIVITGSRRLNFTGSLQIERFNNLESINLKKLKIAYLEISKCSQLNITNLSELTKLTSLSVTGCPKLITLNCLSNGLTSLELSGCYRLNNIDLSKFTKLQSLYLRGYQNLTTLDCSSTEKLISLKISDCAQLKIINLPKSSKLQSLSVIDCPKLTTLDYSANALTSLEISGCKQLNKIANLSKAPKLTSLSLIDCPNVTKLDCSSNEKLTELEVSDLIELNCSSTSIKILSVNLCPDIKILDCSNNDKLINLDISNCTKLEFLDCSNSKLTSLDINNCKSLLKEYEQNGTKSKKFKYPEYLEIIVKRTTKNLIIVGRTGGGKSTLSNVLTESEDFEESGSSISVTKNFQKKKFPWKGKEYNVVDTIGVGDTKLSTKKVLYKVLDGIFSIPEGISQILFVIDGRFTGEEAKIFNLLKGSIFDIFEIGILDYVTIVRTKFSNFKNKDKCDADKEQLHNENEDIAKIVKSCKDVVYVDNPPTNMQITDEDDEETIATNKKIRDRSRKIILEYLDGACQADYFKLKSWDQIREPITKYLESNCEDVPPELEKNKEVEALIKITESFCTIT
ncbi:AIG1 family-domain-containing protein [Rhizophagus diaphanus]|nr:AIG1 family-domain-containing protein [Rhizophagus diaphanus] [Rhizophagus sp. MUCL 43196]